VPASRAADGRRILDIHHGDTRMLMASIYGRLGCDPKPGTTRNGKPMCTARLAVDVGREPGTETLWVSVIAFNALAEALEQHRQGDMLAATGWMNRGKYRAADGSERDSWTLRADGLHGTRSMFPATSRKEESANQRGHRGGDPVGQGGGYPAGPDYDDQLGF
jgi:single-stranded DNA-binding protein